MNENNVETMIRKTTLEIALRKDAKLTDVQLGHSLIDQLGLSSMDLAELIATLEAELGVDPFATIAISSIRTVGDLYAVYRAALV